MKQKLLNSTLYVFDVSPYTITEDASEATVIKVQEESYKGFVEMNPDLIDKLTKYNYHVVCVNTPEWAPYVDEPSTYTVTLTGTGLSAETVTIKNGGETVALAGSYTVEKDAWFEIYPLQDPSYYTLVSENMEYDTEQGNEHWFVMPSHTGTDTTAIELNYAAPATTYTITLDAQNLSDQNIEVKLNDNQVALTGEYVCQDNDTLTFWPLANPSDYIASNMDGFDDTPGQEHWWKTVNSSETIVLTYLGAGVNFNASWDGSLTPENVSQINIGNTSVTGSDLTDHWTATVRLNPGYSQIKYFISTGLPTDMQKFEVDFVYGNDEHEIHYAYKQTHHDTGEAFYSDASDASGTGVTNPGIWTYNNTPDSGLPWIAFTLPSTDKDGNAWADNTEIKIMSSVSGS